MNSGVICFSKLMVSRARASHSIYIYIKLKQHTSNSTSNIKCCRHKHIIETPAENKYLSKMDHVLNRGSSRCMWKVYRQSTLHNMDKYSHTSYDVCISYKFKQSCGAKKLLSNNTMVTATILFNQSSFPVLLRPGPRPTKIERPRITKLGFSYEGCHCCDQTAQDYSRTQ